MCDTALWKQPCTVLWIDVIKTGSTTRTWRISRSGIARHKDSLYIFIQGICHKYSYEYTHLYIISKPSQDLLSSLDSFDIGRHDSDKTTTAASRVVRSCTASGRNTAVGMYPTSCVEPQVSHVDECGVHEVKAKINNQQIYVWEVV